MNFDQTYSGNCAWKYKNISLNLEFLAAVEVSVKVKCVRRENIFRWWFYSMLFQKVIQQSTPVKRIIMKKFFFGWNARASRSSWSLHLHFIFAYRFITQPISFVKKAFSALICRHFCPNFSLRLILKFFLKNKKRSEGSSYAKSGERCWEHESILRARKKFCVLSLELAWSEISFLCNFEMMKNEDKHSRDKFPALKSV